MASRYEEEEVNIFNFSFLDILSCTIGALIFILLLYVISTSDLVERTLFEEIKDKYTGAQAELSEVQEALDEGRAELDRGREQLKQMRAETEKLADDIKIQRAELLGKVREKEVVIKRLKNIIESDLKVDVKQMGGVLATIGMTARRVDQRREKSSELFPNLEQRTLYAFKDHVYIQPLGHSTPATRIGSDPVLMSFLSNVDLKNEELLVIPMGTPGTTYRALQSYINNISPMIGRTIKTRVLSSLPSLPSGTQKVSMDEDNDGRNETLYEDTDSDGVIDMKRIDEDGDGRYELIFYNYDRSSKRWRHRLVDVNLDGAPDEFWIDNDLTNNTYEVRQIGVNLETGIARVEYHDNNGDGIWDTKLVDVVLTDSDYEEKYTDFDKTSKRWLQKTVDINGDGIVDELWVDTDTTNDVWEEKYLDQDGDGHWDIRWQDVRVNDGDWEIRFDDLDRKSGVWMKLAADSDNDGAWDIWLEHKDPREKKHSIKRVDTDGDGKWDKTLHWNTRSGKYVE